MLLLGMDAIVAFDVVNEGEARVIAGLDEVAARLVDTFAAVDWAEEV